MGDKKNPSFIPLLYPDKEYIEKVIKDSFLPTVASEAAVKRIMEYIGCPDDVDPAEFLRVRPVPDVGQAPGIPYGTPRWLSVVLGRHQEDQDTLEDKRPTQSLSGPLEAIRELLRKS